MLKNHTTGANSPCTALLWRCEICVPEIPISKPPSKIRYCICISKRNVNNSICKYRAVQMYTAITNFYIELVYCWVLPCWPQSTYFPRDETGLVCLPHRVHREATAAFWRTFSHQGKISPGWWRWGVHAHHLSLHLPSPVKLQCTLQLSGQAH